MVRAFEFSALITEGTSYFIIVYDATLTAPRYPEIKIEVTGDAASIAVSSKR